MPKLDLRVDDLERRAGDQDRMTADLTLEMTALRGELRELRGEVRTDFRRLEHKVDRHFMWLVGLQIAGLIAVIGALAGAYAR